VSNDSTKTRILEAAWRLARHDGLTAVTIGEIAKAAGVSRQLVYFHFTNRAGLLVAMTRHQDTRSGFRERALATRELPPEAALEALMREWAAYLP
jgi:AcrR family transcriptional regulator